MPRSISQFNDPIFQPPASAFYPPDFRERRISRCQHRNRNELLIARILIDFLESVKDILSSNSHRLNSNDCNSVRGSFGNRGAGNRSKNHDEDMPGYTSQFLLGRGERIPGRDRKHSVHEETGERWNEAVERVRGTGHE